MWIDWRMGRNEIKNIPKWGAIKNVHQSIVTDFYSLRLGRRIAHCWLGSEILGKKGKTGRKH